jgi:hypothetical protein
MGASAELPKNLHTVLFLSFQEMTLKQRNEFVTATGLERILTQLDDGTPRWIGGPWQVSYFRLLIPARTCF